MNDPIAMLEWLVDAQQGIPTLAEMPRRTLSDKGIAGPTAATRYRGDSHAVKSCAGYLYHRQ